MIETFGALFFAHVIADYVAQTSRMVQYKHRPATIAVHVLIVFVSAAVAVGFVGWGALLALTGAHAAMDLIKTHLLPGGKLWPYLLDQAVHIATLVVVSLAAPDLVSRGLWSGLGTDGLAVLTLAFLIIGFAIFAIRAGGFAVDLVLQASPRDCERCGLLQPSCWFGQVERGILFLLCVIGQPIWIALLIAAKSALRLSIAGSDRAALHYAMLGMVASLGWTVATAVVLLNILPNGALETLGLTP